MTPVDPSSHRRLGPAVAGGPHYAAPAPPPPARSTLGTSTVVWRTVAIGAGSLLVAAVLGVVSFVAAYAILSADGDTGYFEGLGSFLLAVVAFVVVGGLSTRRPWRSPSAGSCRVDADWFPPSCWSAPPRCSSVCRWCSGPDGQKSSLRPDLDLVDATDA